MSAGRSNDDFTYVHFNFGVRGNKLMHTSEVPHPSNALRAKTRTETGNPNQVLQISSL
jgi:hypothetical protein